MPNIKTSLTAQEKVAKFVKETYDDYLTLNKKRHETLLKVYKTFSTYEEQKKADWQTSFKLNKAHEIVERVLPRIIARNPRWIVTPKLYDFFEDQDLPEDEQEREKEIKRRNELRNDYSKAIGDYLAYIFDEYDFETILRSYAKNMVVYGQAWARIGYKYEMFRQKQKKAYELEEGNIDIQMNVEEQVIGEHPTIEVRNWTNILFDPRYRFVDEMPALIEIDSNVRLSDLERNKKFFNLDKIKKAYNKQSERGQSTKEQILSIRGINWVETPNPDKNKITLLTYYGWYNLDDKKPEEEKMYKIVVLKELGTVIYFEEISRIPYVDIKAFEDTDTGFAVGFIEPMMSLQDELNFKKNSASEYINQALNRSWLWSEQSGVDPRDLISKPGNIIVTTNGVQQAKQNLEELPMRQVPSDYFQEQIDFERQIQSATFTIDTANPKGEQALTNTATGMRIKFFESNSVLDEVRKHFEKGLEQLAYQLLQETFENMDENIVLKKMDADEYWEINKEALRDAVRRYTIKVETNSSSFDSIETKRNDAIAFWNILAQAKQLGLEVDLGKGIEGIIQTFEKKNPADYLMPPNMTQLAQQMPMTEGMAQAPQEPASLHPEQLTDQVAGGDVGSIVSNQPQ